MFKIVSMAGHHLHAFGDNEPLLFKTEQDAEQALKKYLGDDYYIDREFYDIVSYNVVSS